MNLDATRRMLGEIVHDEWVVTQSAEPGARLLRRLKWPEKLHQLKCGLKALLLTEQLFMSA